MQKINSVFFSISLFTYYYLLFYVCCIPKHHFCTPEFLFNVLLFSDKAVLVLEGQKWCWVYVSSYIQMSKFATLPLPQAGSGKAQALARIEQLPSGATV